MIKQKQIYIVPSWHCNLNCSHCFVHLKKDEYNKDVFISKLNELKTNYSEACFILHGGEPTLYQDRYFDILNTNSIDSICTNLIVNDTIIDDLNKRNIAIATSWNPYRFNKDTYNIWINNIKKLESKPRILITLDKDLIGYDINLFMQFLKELENLKIKEILFEVLVNNSLDDTFQNEVDEWLCNLHQLWKDYNLGLNNIIEQQILHWDFRCDSLTLYPDGQVKRGCILGDECHRVLDKCLHCNLAKVCKPCVLHSRCSFFPKLYNLIKNA